MRNNRFLNDGYGKMQVKCVKAHKYLGMKLDDLSAGQVRINMLEYIDEILDTFDKAYPMGVGTNSIAEPDILPG